MWWITVALVSLVVPADPCWQWTKQEWERCAEACRMHKEEISACYEGECYCCTAGECLPLVFIEPGC